MKGAYFAPEHSGELLGDPLEQLLDGGRVANKCRSHFQSSGWDVADGSFDVIRNPDK